MIRIEQLRAETLERLERLDRRLAQIDQRLARMEQRWTTGVAAEAPPDLAIVESMINR